MLPLVKIADVVLVQGDGKGDHLINGQGPIMVGIIRPTNHFGHFLELSVVLDLFLTVLTGTDLDDLLLRGTFRHLAPFQWSGTCIADIFRVFLDLHENLLTLVGIGME